METVIEQITALKNEVARLTLHVEHLNDRFELFKKYVDERLDSHSRILRDDE